MEAMASSSRVGYDCGEHDYNEDGNSGLHHLQLRGETLDEDGWGDLFPVNGYISTVTELAELRGAAAHEMNQLPPEKRSEIVDIISGLRDAVWTDDTLKATPAQRQKFDDELTALLAAAERLS